MRKFYQIEENRNFKLVLYTRRKRKLGYFNFLEIELEITTVPNTI